MEHGLYKKIEVVNKVNTERITVFQSFFFKGFLNKRYYYDENCGKQKSLYIKIKPLKGKKK